MVKLSLCMIVKNEEAFLEQCLQSVQGLVDEIIIVDTGSTDKTKEIARRFTEKVFDFKWCDDFAAARNESLKYAVGDWILVLDADEVIAKEDFEKIQKAVLNQNYLAYQVVTANYSDDSLIQGWVPIALNNSLACGFKGWHPSVKIRLFQRNSGATFQGRIHEIISEGCFLGKVGTAQLLVHHYGELKKDVSKKGNYLGLLLQKVADDPKSSKSLFELGVQYKFLGNLIEAEKCFQKAVELDFEAICPRLDLAIIKSKWGDFSGSLMEYDFILRKKPNLPEALFGRGFCFFKQGNLGKGIEDWEKAVEINPLYLEAYINLGAVYEQQGKFVEALNNLKKALEISPQAARAYHNLGVVQEKLGKLNLALNCYQRAVELGYKKEGLSQRVEKIKEFLAEQTHG